MKQHNFSAKGKSEALQVTSSKNLANNWLGGFEIQATKIILGIF